MITGLTGQQTLYPPSLGTERHQADDNYASGGYEFDGKFPPS